MASKLNFNQLLNHEDVDVIFTLEEEIASGSFGTVYKGCHLPTGKVLAIKIITPEEDEIPEDLMIEIAVLKQCKHENIVEFFGGYRKGDEIFIALELCSCSVRDIFEYSEEPLLEKEIALITRETLKGLDYMHRNNLIHRDIKGANILLTEGGDVKLVDFGVSSLNAKKAKTFVGTPYWMAPEIIESKNTLSGYGPEIDIWALGITLIELAETAPPLSYINPMRALFQIPARDPPTLEKKQRWSPLFHDFLAKCLEKNPKRRPSAVELMNHPFVRDCDDNKKILVDFIKRKRKYEASNRGEYCEEEEEEQFKLPDISALPSLNPALPNISPHTSPLQSPSTSPAQSPLQTANHAHSNPLTKGSSTSNMHQAVEKKNLAQSAGWNPSPTRWNSQNNLSHSAVSPSSSGKLLANQRSSTHSREENDENSLSNSSNIANPNSRPIHYNNNMNNNNNYADSNSNNYNYSSDSSSNLSSSQSITPSSSDLSQSGNLDSPSPLRQKSTLKRPPPTNREGNKPTQNNQMKAINKRIIKEQMGELRNLQNRLQKKIAQLEKDHQRERDQFAANVKKNFENVEKKLESQKRSMERQYKTDQEGLMRFQQKEQKNLLKHHEGESKAFQRDIKEQIKVATKSHLDNQRNRGKDQKNELKDGKKNLSKNEFKTLEKQHKVELQINELLFQKSQDRAKLLKEQEIAWTQQKDHNKNKQSELQQSQQMELDSLKQLYGTDVEAHNENFSWRQEEITKIQPVVHRQYNDLHQLQIQNLQQQLDLEKTQQTALLLADQRAQTKDYREKKKRMEKDHFNELKAIERNNKGKSKIELKNLQNDCRSKFQAAQQQMDREFEELLAKQRQEEEEQMKIHQNSQHEQLLKKQREEMNELQLEHTKQVSDFHADEIGERDRMLVSHQTKMKELQEKLHKDQSDLLDIQHQELLMLMKRTQKASIEFVENQRKELQAFIAANADKFLAGAQQTFNQQIDTHFEDILNQLQKEHQNNQRAMSSEMEVQHAELQEKQRGDINNLEDFQRRQRETSAFVPVTVSLS